MMEFREGRYFFLFLDGDACHARCEITGGLRKEPVVWGKCRSLAIIFAHPLCKLPISPPKIKRKYLPPKFDTEMNKNAKNILTSHAISTNYLNLARNSHEITIKKLNICVYIHPFSQAFSKEGKGGASSPPPR